MGGGPALPKGETDQLLGSAGCLSKAYFILYIAFTYKIFCSTFLESVNFFKAPFVIVIGQYEQLLQNHYKNYWRWLLIFSLHIQK